MRKQLLAQRDQFAAGPEAAAAAESLSGHLRTLLAELEPDVLGLYWPLRSEFNAASWIAADVALAKLPRALPFARRTPVEMDYRLWDGDEPSERDECGIHTATGAIVVPDVVIVPCVGFTADGYRLGYGGGYFDRWLAKHPGVTAIGVAWSAAEIPAGIFKAKPHDKPLTLIATELGIN